MDDEARNKYDEELIKRAGHGARNLRILGFLSFLCSLSLVFLSFTTKPDLSMMLIPALGAFFMTSAFFILAVSTSRGNTFGLIIVAVTLFIYCVINFTFQLISKLCNSGTASSINFFPFIFLGLVIYCLTVNRSEMKEIIQSGLEQRVYSGKKNGKILAIIGSFLFIVGVLTIIGGMFGVAYVSSNQQKQHRMRADKFLAILNNESKSFAQNTSEWMQNPNPEAKKKVDISLSDVEQAVTQLDKEAEKEQPKLKEITTYYLKALQSWRNGIEMFSSISPGDRQKAMEEFKQGDLLQQEAIEMFKARYILKKQ